MIKILWYGLILQDTTLCSTTIFFRDRIQILLCIYGRRAHGWAGGWLLCFSENWAHCNNTLLYVLFCNNPWRCSTMSVCISISAHTSNFRDVIELITMCELMLFWELFMQLADREIPVIMSSAFSLRILLLSYFPQFYLVHLWNKLTNYAASHVIFIIFHFNILFK